MRRSTLPIAALPAWCKLNDVTFLDTAVTDQGPKGYGLTLQRKLSSKDTFDTPTLLIVPNELVLSAAAIEEHAKVDHHFYQLLDVAGGKSLRGDVLLFLLMQVTIASDYAQNVGLSTPWTEFVKMLPDVVPVPTMWSEEERVMLVGTSLESALTAKMTNLGRELDALRESTSEISWCQKCWWDKGFLQLRDWYLLDAWYKSRCVELPLAGESMVPCLDFANHSSEPNAYYDQTSDGSAAILLRPDIVLDIASEILISYGNSKSAAEMLFSYGFIDEQGIRKELVLTLEPQKDDPLGKAKIAAFDGLPVVRVRDDNGMIKWESPFLYLMCLNEEDGLNFRVLQETNGTRTRLKMFWQGSDVTEKSTTFEALMAGHELQQVFRLRAIVILQDRIRQQLEQLYGSEGTVESLVDLSLVEPDRYRNASLLRSTETAILKAAFTSTNEQKTQLLKDENVLRYLGSMDPNESQADHSQRDAVDTNDDDDDFS